MGSFVFKSLKNMGDKGMFAAKEIIVFGFVCISLGLITGLAFGNYKNKKYEIYQHELTNLKRNQSDHEKNHQKLIDEMNTNIKKKIAELSTRKVWHNCHDKSGNTIFPKGIEWSKPPNAVIGQTMMQFTAVPTGNIYDADVDVKVAADNKSYDIKMPPAGKTKACVIFIPNEAA